MIPHLDLTAAYYGVHQNAYGTGGQAGCTTAAFGVCSGNLDVLSFDADYILNRHLDVYAGAMYSGVHNGLASGYAFNTTNINPTIGVRYKSDLRRLGSIAWERRGRIATACTFGLIIVCAAYVTQQTSDEVFR